MGAWGDEPWGNDLAADWFASFFDGVDFDTRMTSALDDFDIDEYDRVRAASYILQVLGRVYVWPGDPDKLYAHLQRALSHLSNMVDPAHELFKAICEMCGEDADVFASIKAQIREIEARLSEGSWADVREAEEEPEDDVVPNTVCKRPDCNAPRVKFSVLCSKHHRESMRKSGHSDP